jgi:hypothetical protein
MKQLASALVCLSSVVRILPSGILVPLLLALLLAAGSASAQSFTEEEIQRLSAAADEIQVRGLTGSTLDEAFALEEIYYRYGLDQIILSRGLEELFNPSLSSGCAQPNALVWQQQIVQGDATLALVCPAQDCKALAELELRLGQGEVILAAGALGFTIASSFFPGFTLAAGAYGAAALTVHAYLAFVVRPCQQGLACP